MPPATISSTRGSSSGPLLPKSASAPSSCAYVPRMNQPSSTRSLSSLTSDSPSWGGFVAGSDAPAKPLPVVKLITQPWYEFTSACEPKATKIAPACSSSAARLSWIRGSNLSVPPTAPSAVPGTLPVTVTGAPLFSLPVIRSSACSLCT